MKSFLLPAVLLFLFSCDKKQTSVTTFTPDTAIELQEVPTEKPEEKISASETVRDQNFKIVSAAKAQNYSALATYIHPEKGVTFSMYGYIDLKTDKKFSRQEFDKYLESPVKFTWGQKDGTGEAYITTLKNYLQEWVFKRDYSSAEILENNSRPSGNSINNIKDIYPHAQYIENFLPGSEKYGGMDWSAVRLVFEEKDGTTYLVAIISDQWTT